MLQDVNFEIIKNKITGFFGDSGSGKSTILNILLGYFNQQRDKFI